MIEKRVVEKLITEAESIKVPPPKPKTKDAALELYKVIGTLHFDKGFTYKKCCAWLNRRGFNFLKYHMKLASDKYWKEYIASKK